MSSYTHYGNVGIGFNLVREFTTRDDMITEFSKGELYTEVRQGEYVIIGQDGGDYAGNIYRRGFNLANGVGGAIYITNILGAALASIEERVGKVVVANPTDAATITLTKLTVGEFTYNIPTAYAQAQAGGYTGTEAEFIAKFADLLNMSAAEEESF